MAQQYEGAPSSNEYEEVEQGLTDDERRAIGDQAMASAEMTNDVDTTIGEIDSLIDEVDLVLEDITMVENFVQAGGQ